MTSAAMPYDREDRVTAVLSEVVKRNAPAVHELSPSAQVKRASSQHSEVRPMIRHIVFFTGKPGVSVEEIRDGLSVLTRIPFADRLEIAVNRKSDPISQEVDIVVYGEFADDAALAAYKAHDLYQESIRIVRPLRKIRMVADFEV
jgi:hypothetical protein